jgi:acyl carrier protein
MTEEELKSAVVHVLGTVAPDFSPEKLMPEVNFRDQFDFDSVDFLNFALALQEKLKIKIPEMDFPKLSSLKGCLAYLMKARAA